MANGRSPWADVAMRVRLTKKLAERVDDVDLSDRVVGDVLEVPERDAACLIAEGWAVLEDTPDRLTPDQNPSLEARTAPASIAPTDGLSVERLIEDVERLATSALDHEHRLTALASALDGGRAAVAPGANLRLPNALGDFDLTLGAAELAASWDLPATLRELSHSAREQRELAETVMARMVSEVSHAAGSPERRPRVLIVDDSEDSRELAALVLETSGVETISARNGLEGVIAAHQARPSVVLMDIAMPVLDGIEAARLLKASAMTKDLNVIAYTAKPDFHQGPLGRLFADVLAKPASPETILASVRRFIEAGDRIQSAIVNTPNGLGDVRPERA